MSSLSLSSRGVRYTSTLGGYLVIALQTLLRPLTPNPPRLECARLVSRTDSIRGRYLSIGILDRVGPEEGTGPYLPSRNSRVCTNQGNKSPSVSGPGTRTRVPDLKTKARTDLRCVVVERRTNVLRTSSTRTTFGLNSFMGCV